MKSPALPSCCLEAFLGPHRMSRMGLYAGWREEDASTSLFCSKHAGPTKPPAPNLFSDQFLRPASIEGVDLVVPLVVEVRNHCFLFLRIYYGLCLRRQHLRSQHLLRCVCVCVCVCVCARTRASTNTSSYTHNYTIVPGCVCACMHAQMKTQARPGAVQE